jgi:homoserine O-acetyltransferase
VEGVVSDMLRVGRRCIVSFPNFAYHKLRKVLAEQGRAPETAGLLRYKWHNSPNIRFFSLADFEEFCAERGITVHRRIALDTEGGKEISADPNLNADLAIFVISR